MTIFNAYMMRRKTGNHSYKVAMSLRSYLRSLPSPWPIFQLASLALTMLSAPRNRARMDIAALQIKCSNALERFVDQMRNIVEIVPLKQHYMGVKFARLESLLVRNVN
jgi:hypothetical protein